MAAQPACRKGIRYTTTQSHSFILWISLAYSLLHRTHPVWCDLWWDPWWDPRSSALWRGSTLQWEPACAVAALPQHQAWLHCDGVWYYRVQGFHSGKRVVWEIVGNILEFSKNRGKRDVHYWICFGLHNSTCQVCLDVHRCNSRIKRGTSAAKVRAIKDSLMNVICKSLDEKPNRHYYQVYHPFSANQGAEIRQLRLWLVYFSLTERQILKHRLQSKCSADYLNYIDRSPKCPKQPVSAGFQPYVMTLFLVP